MCIFVLEALIFDGGFCSFTIDVNVRRWWVDW